MDFQANDPERLPGRNDARLLTLGLVLAAGTLFVGLAAARPACCRNSRSPPRRSPTSSSTRPATATIARLQRRRRAIRAWSSPTGPTISGSAMSTSRPAPSCPPTATARWSRRTPRRRPTTATARNGCSRTATPASSTPSARRPATRRTTQPPRSAWPLRSTARGRPPPCSNSVGRASPSATLDLGDPDPRINYVNTDKTAWYMRKASALGVEIQLPLS